MFAMPLAIAMDGVAETRRDRCAKMSRELEPSGTHSALYPSEAISSASARTAPASRSSNANVQAPMRPSRSRTAS